MTKPDPYRWVIIAAGALMTCVALGAMFSLAVFLEPIATATGWSRAGVSSAMRTLEANPSIARQLSLSTKTVGNYVSNIFTKLQVADRAQAIIRAREAGLG